MSNGVKGGASRVSIPNVVKKMIENIKEFTGQNHSEDDIYAMLKECNMDPNETTQKLLLLDTFHEVKRKRDRRKENMPKESAELKWKSGPQARANRVSRGNYPSRYVPQDAVAGRNTTAVKENATSHLAEKNYGKAPLTTSQDMIKNETSSSASPTTVVSNGPSGITSLSTNIIHKNHGEDNSSIASNKNTDAVGGKVIKQQQILDSSSTAASVPSPAAVGSFLSFSDTVPLPDQDLRLPNAVGIIQRELGTEDEPTEQLDDNRSESKSASITISASEVGTTTLEQKVPNDFKGIGKNQHSESLQNASSAFSRPSSNYNNRSQMIGLLKVGPDKEWKPKSTNPHLGQAGITARSSEIIVVSGGDRSEPQATPVCTSKETTLEVHRKLEETHISDSQHVIIPNHLHVPEVEKLGFCFGSFDASFGLDMNQNCVPGIEKSPPMSNSADPVDELVEELQLGIQDALVAAEDTDVKYPDQLQSSSQGLEDFPTSKVEVSSSINPDYSESKPEVTPGSRQQHVVNTSNYSFGFMPPTLSSQLSPSERSEFQDRDASRSPGFVMPQSFDPASYYAQFYRSGLDGDGHMSSFQSAGPGNKYTGNAALVSAQTSQTPQELQGGTPLVLSTVSQTPLVAQAAGVMQSSMTATQQPLPAFRQPTGLHSSHYPHNFMPYGPYFSPFYVPPPTIHQFLSNGAFPQQSQAGGLYQSAPGTNVKNLASQYKQGSNMVSPAHIVVPSNFGPYGLSIPNYTSASATVAVTSMANEDTAPSQAKDNNVYVSGQQNDSSGVWYTAPGCDISALQASTFYNLPQGQLAFASAQPGHVPFRGVFHPSQAVTAANVHPLLQQSQATTSNPIDMVGPTSGVYQPPQHTQLNWPSNY